MLSTNTYILISSLFLLIVQYGDTQKCPEIPIFSSDKIVDIELFYGPLPSKALQEGLCRVIKDFAGLLNIKFRMGALSQVSDDGKLSCGASNCSTDREKGCQSMLASNFDTCEPMEKYASNEFDNCMSNFESDGILIENGNLRRNYGIADDALPAFVFSGFYDPCEKLTCYDDIKNYICALYYYDVPTCFTPDK